MTKTVHFDLEARQLFGESLVGSFNGDFETLEALAIVEQMKKDTPDPLDEINRELMECDDPHERNALKQATFMQRYGVSSSDLVRHCEEPTSGTND